jgi:glycosyltransferase involved in cell wall biosynthesis
MRALFLVHNLENRGSYFRALEIAKRVAARGHYVQFCYVGDKRKYRPTYRPEDVTMAEMPYFTLFNDRQEGWSIFDNATRIRDALKTRWDLVYGFSHKPDCVLPGLAAKLRGATFVLDWADWWGGPEGLYRHCVIPSNGFQSMPAPLRFGRRTVFRMEEIWEPIVYSWADAVTLISEEYLKHKYAPYNLQHKSLVMHSGAPLAAIRPMDKHVARQSIGLQVPPASTVLGYVANFHMDERLLMEAFAQVCRTRDDVHLVVVGADLEATTPEIHALTHDRLHHFGRQPFERMREFLGACDILLLPLTDIALDRARYPHKLSDYVAAGRPIVACNVGETGRVLMRYMIGNLCRPDAQSFAAEILKLANHQHAWPKLGSDIRHAAEHYFNWDEICKRLFKFIEQQTGLHI